VRASRLRVSPLNAELNPICHLLALLWAHHILHVSGLRVNFSTNTDAHTGSEEMRLFNDGCDDGPA